MYRCQDCEFEFLYAKQHEEHHQQTEPPFEKLCVCPNCKSTNFSKIKIRYCRFCGRKLKANMSEYCTKECKMRGDIMWREQARRKNLYESNLKYFCFHVFQCLILINYLYEHNQRMNSHLYY